ncbi:RNA polymerase sigma factor [Azorhizobium oxalatiphilum]|uniref:RNA polymerase sigma factor n=1 Tax=Azorhizobium oxalatiphilum TaxID=980631 RepID=A0A917C466_9HYPH|nr:sigma-70 family RNA polymerase sigma factor [Azorhizobium oxalatiphilum]GGF69131.1 RNA polymerase sigma factor [Azorhizobium oxalatiphilum]
MGVRDMDERRMLYVSHRASLVEYAAMLLGSREGAEDLVQEAFARLEPADVAQLATPRAYLFRIVRNLAFNLRRRRRLESTHATEDAAPAWAAPQLVETPEQRLLMAERLRRLAAVMDAMPDDMRTVFELYRFEGLTLEQIAQASGLSVATVHRRLRDAMAALALELNPDA